MESVERIEFVRGPSSALYGSNAMFGVINIVTKKGRGVDGFDLNCEAGSWNTKRAAATLGTTTRRELDLLLSVQAGCSDGEDLYFAEYDRAGSEGIARGLDWEQFVNFHTVLTLWEWTLEALYNDRWKGIPTAAWGMEFNDDAAQSRDRLGMLCLIFDQEIDHASRMSLRMFYNHYAYTGIYLYEESDWRDVNNCHWVGAEGQLRRDINAQNRLFCGIEYQQHLAATYKSWDADTVYFDNNFPYSIGAVFLQDELQVSSKFAMITGMRYDQHSRSKGGLSPRLGLFMNPFPTSTLKLLHGSAFRAPNVYETYYEDPYLAKGNSALKPEKITTSELIWEQAISAGLLSEMALYYYSMENLIDQMLDPADSLLQFRNLAEVRAYGVEWDLRANLKKGWYAYINLNVQRAADFESGQPLSNSPGLILKAGVSLPLLSRLYLYSEGIYESGRYSIRDTKTTAYFLCNAGLKVTRIRKRLSCSLRVKNLFDTGIMLPAAYEHELELIVQPRRYIGVVVSYSR
ncbi:MAG TPA: TonB-dependent receptor [Candidatus Marinimicrobia bacterium]|nr:TonB-dependent receptor [Candidatus Neomarinimicrobiota bacterium]